MFQDAKGTILYVGKAKNLKSRVSSYFASSGITNKIIRLRSQAEKIEHIVVNSELEAFLLEAHYIKKHRPYYNVKLTDDKSYPYVEITEGPNASVTITRKVSNPTSEYFGPYADVTGLKYVLKMVRRLFPFQSVKNHPKRKCLYYHLGLCPCVLVFTQHESEYKKNLKKIASFLQGDINQVKKMLLQEQKIAVKEEEFEKASFIQKQLERIEIITSPDYSPFSYEQKPDLYFQRIAKEKSSLEKILQRNGLMVGELKRIECYDISNFQGSEATGSMVVFTDGDIDKKEYRRFKIRSKNTPDDFLMHQEMMERRLMRKDWARPDLLVIDGGKGQVSSVLEVLEKLGHTIPMIGLAKREEIIVIPKRIDGVIHFTEINIDNKIPGINLLRRIRDEAHRFAITYHKLLRKKRMGI
jgi:excinuclease ABC subunit C